MREVPVYVLSYDLHAPGRDYKRLFEAITSPSVSSKSVRMLESLWLISSSLTAKEIIAALSEHVDANDSLFVAPLAHEEWAGRNSMERIHALRDNFTLRDNVSR